MTSKYYTAQVYLIECTHPDYSELKYVGLDTKCDPAYLSSSTVVKWHINKLGRKYFKKSILETTSGTMMEICELEQKYIKMFNSVKDPNFMNMSGGRQVSSAEEMLIDLSWSIQPCHYKAKDFVGELVKECSEGIKPLTHSKRQLVLRILCMCCYGALKYHQHDFEYSQHMHYGTCKPEDTQRILTALSDYGLLDSGLDLIKITDDLLDRLEEHEIDYTHFRVVNLY